MSEQQRDGHGRWPKGVSGNPRGRPRKLSKVDFGDLERFKNTLCEIETPHGPKLMTREAVVQERLYVSALKGNVHAQIHLDRKFERANLDRAEIIANLNMLTLDIVTKQREPTEAEAEWIYAARVLLREIPRPGERMKTRRSRAKKNRAEAGAAGDQVEREVRLRELVKRWGEMAAKAAAEKASSGPAGGSTQRTPPSQS